MATGGESPTAVVGAGAVGQPTSARPVGVTGSTDSENSGTDAGSGAGSGEATGGAATDDPSRSGSGDDAGVRIGHRKARTLWRRQEHRHARGRARKSPGCVVDHRRNDWASHSPHGESELVIMIAVLIEEMVGSD